MSTLLELIKALTPSIHAHRDRDEAYLAEAADLSDLELRMRAIDQRGREAAPDLVFCVGLR